MFYYVWDLSDISLGRKTVSHVLWWTVFQLPKTMQMVVSKKLIFMSLEYGLSSAETCGVATRTNGHEVLNVHCV
jgi:hypothetical protein